MTKAKQKYRSSDLETMVMVIYFVSMRFYFLHFYTNTFESLLPFTFTLCVWVLLPAHRSVHHMHQCP